MELEVSPKVRHKLAVKHGVEVHEIEQCFCNVEGIFLKDTREDHKTDPPSMWFIAETDYGKKLKVIFIVKEDKSITIKSAFTPNDNEIRIYNKYSK